MEEENHEHIHLAKKLAHNTKKIRDQAMKKLTTFIAMRSQMSHMEMMKLWKGIFYCFWMSDKVPVQHELAEKISQLTVQLEQERALLYVQCGLETFAREWTMIDRLRMDKYLTLVRKFYYHIIKCLQKYKYELSFVEKMNDVLTQTVLTEDPKKVGLFLHVAEVTLVEISRLNTDSDPKAVIPWDALNILLKPYYVELAVGHDEAIIKRVTKSIIEPIQVLYMHQIDQAVADMNKDQDGDNNMNGNGEAEEKLEFQQPEYAGLYPTVINHIDSFSQTIFTIASDKTTLAKRRKHMYSIYTDLCTMISTAQKQGISMIPEMSEPEQPKSKSKASKKNVKTSKKAEKVEPVVVEAPKANKKRKQEAEPIIEEEDDEPVQQPTKKAKVAPTPAPVEATPKKQQQSEPVVSKSTVKKSAKKTQEAEPIQEEVVVAAPKSALKKSAKKTAPVEVEEEIPVPEPPKSVKKSAKKAPQPQFEEEEEVEIPAPKSAKKSMIGGSAMKRKSLK